MNFQSLVGRLRRQAFTRPISRTRARSKSRLRIEELERREVPAVLPSPIVDPQSIRNITPNSPAANTGFAPAMVADPNNPLRLIEANVVYTNTAQTETAISFRLSTNGGKSWGTASSFGRGVDPKASVNTIVFFTNVSNPSVAIDPFGNHYITWIERDPGNTSGRVLISKNGGTTKTLYQWVDTDQAFNPVVGIDTNRASFTDPQGGVQTDPLAAAQNSAANVRVFVAWNTQTVPPPNPPQDPAFFNPNVIMAAVSDDGGTDFAAPVIVNDDRYFSNPPPGAAANDPTRYSQPSFVFLPGRAGDPTSGGRMLTLYSDFGVNALNPITGTRVVSDERRFTPTTIPHVVEVTNSQSQVINTVGETLFPVNLTGQLSSLTAIHQMSVTLALNHNSMQELLVELVAPNGTSAVLFLNGVNAAGNTIQPPQGIDGTELGRINGFSVGTTFQDNAARTIRMGATPRIGTFRPEVGSLLGAFGGLTQAQINGVWQIRITDFVATQNPDPVPVIRFATLRISQNYADPGQISNDVNIGAAPAIGNAAGIGYTARPAFAANVGFGPGVSVAVDNTLGGFSPYQNRVYVAYTDQSNNVRVKYGDFDAGTNRVVWSGKNTLVGPGFMPKLSVDATTGTLVLAYYSAFPDAANARSSMMVTTAVNAWDDLIPFGAGPGDGIRQAAEEDNLYGNTADGRIEFAPSVSVNAKELYFDQIRSEVLQFESIPSNQNAAGPEGFGNNVGLAVYNGRITLLYAGNLNTTANQIRTQNMTIAAGPRVVNGDMGAVLEEAVTPTKATVYDFFGTPSIEISGGEQYNSTAAADGRRQFDGFVVEFDRPVDPATFGVGDISIKFRSPTDNPVTGGTDITATEIIVLDTIEEPISGRVIGSKRFLVKLPPQSEVGTYSYVVHADVRDRIRGRNFEYVNQTAETKTFSSGGPAQISDADGINPGFGFSLLTIPVPPPPAPPPFLANRVIGDLRVHVNISHLDVSQLKLELYAFDTDQTILLVNDGELPQGENFGTFVNGQPDLYTTFDDNAPNILANDVAPYTATYRPAEQLQQLSTNLVNGTNWFLIVTDTVQGHTGIIQDWKLEVTPAVLTITNVDGNIHDQDSDGREGEVDQDLFAVPNPVNGTPFVLPYSSGSLPVVITGPRIVNTMVQGQFTSEKGATDILVKNSTANFIDVAFDRTINATTFKPEDVLGITGPLGNIPLNGVKVTPITALGGATTTGNSRFFRVEFAQQKLSGYYRIQLGPNITDTFGNALDTDMDAGVANLKGASVGAPVETRSYGGLELNVPLPANTTTTVNLNVTEAYQLLRPTVTIDIDHAHTRDLEGRLIAPDGTSVLLFFNAPKTGDDEDFRVTTFDDAATTPVQLGGGHFANASFNPMQPLAQLNNHASQGTWKLVIKNSGLDVGTVRMFKLGLDKPQTGTGLGEAVADQASIGFRIFQVDPTNPTSKANWTPMGPAGHGLDDTVGRVSSVAVDPSDPSGNTVYVAGASGGVWRSTNFMTHDPLGPTWVPLTDFGPTNAINVGSIAVIPDPNGDPLKTTIMVGTGSDALNEIDTGEFRFDGVGLLLSEDAGKTWQVLDSDNNYDAVTGVYRAVTDSARNHVFVGAVVNKVVFEKNRNIANNRPIVYAAVGRGSAAAGTEGLWRSEDGGRSWQQLFSGEATDFILSEGSALPNSGFRPTIAYLAIEGTGVLRTVQLNNTNPSFFVMGGGVGRPTVSDITDPFPTIVGVDAPPDTPNGAKGKIALAAPVQVPGDPLANTYYQSWLYAAVSDTNGDLNGLYLTKDAGDNWTRVKLVYPPLRLGDNGPNSEPLNNEGNNSLTIAVDPNNPNIVYLGGDRILRIDTTFLNDPFNLSLYNHSNVVNAGGDIRQLTLGGVDVKLDRTQAQNVGGGLIGFNPETGLGTQTPSTGLFERRFRADPRQDWNFVNLARDPYNPFLVDTTLVTINVLKFNNTGNDVSWTIPAVERDRLDPSIQLTEDGVLIVRPDLNPMLFVGSPDFDFISQIITVVDPLTGKARMIFGSDEGVGTFVSEANGLLNEVNGFTQPGANLTLDKNFQVDGKRNGNLQVARLYSGDVQPSLLAAQISQSLLLGAGHRMGDAVVSNDNILGSGNNQWIDVGRPGTANYVAADAGGSGTVYILRRINDLPAAQQFRTDFFQVQLNGGIPISRTNGLFQSTADAEGTGQWNNQVRRFTVNPIDKDGIIMGSNAGRLFRSTNMGLNWFEIGAPAVLGNSLITATAFAAPETTTAALNDHIYVGTQSGQIFVTVKGGGAAANWIDISAGLNGAKVEKILTNPTRGTHEAFAVTATGVFRMADWTAAGATWEDITANILDIQHLGFGRPEWSTALASTTQGTSALLTLAVDWRPTYSPTVGQPVLYVGSDGGVYKAVYNASLTTWARYTGAVNGASSDGGGMPVVKVTDLDLALGNIDKNTGRAIPNGSPDMLVATTLGRGTWGIIVDVPEGTVGPRVIESSPTTPQFAPVTQVMIKFDSFIDPSSVSTADVVVTGPNGQIIPIASIVEDAPPPPNQPDLHDVWLINFLPPGLAADGTYTITVGPHIVSGSMEMDQDGDTIKGEPIQDQFVMKVIIGLNDLADYVKDTFQKLLGRLPTTAEFAAVQVKNMETARLTALGVVVKELLSTFNANEARTKLIQRLFNNGNAAGEFGHLLPGYVLPTDELTFYINAMKNGTKGPENIAIDIIATTDVTKGFYQDYFVAAGGTPLGFVNKLYADLFKGTGIQFSWLPANVQTTQLTQAATPAGRLNLTRSLVTGTVVRYTDPATPGVQKTIDFRSHMVQLTYQRYLGRAATPAEVTTGKSLMARPLAINSINGSEWLYWKVMSSLEYFNRVPAQADGLPDDGLHTNRAWVQAVINDRMYRVSTAGEEDTYSQKLLTRFKTQRAAFVNSIVLASTPLGMAYRDLEITKYFQLAHARNPSDAERASAQTALKNGSTFTGLTAGRFASQEFFQTSAPQFAGGAVNTTTWARAVYIRLFNLNLPGNDPRITSLAAQGGTQASRQTAVVNLLNSASYRDILITDRFQLLLGRLPTTNELTAYRNFLATRRWETLITDIIANGNASATITAGLPRQFWEVVN